MQGKDQVIIMKMMTLIAVLIVLASALLIVPAVHASSGAVLTANNVYGNIQHNFTVKGAMFFGLYTNGSQSVSVLLINKTTGSIVSSYTVKTGANGIYQSWVTNNFFFFDLSNLGPGAYKLQAWIAGSPVANVSVSISYPRYTSFIETKLSSFSSNNSYFVPGSIIGVSVFTEDQFGNPMSGNTSAGLSIILSAGSSNSSLNSIVSLTPNDYGIATYLLDSGVIGMNAGRYVLVTNFSSSPPGSSAVNPETGYAFYYIVQDTMTISPYSPTDVYGQGTTLKFSADLYPYNGKVNFTVASMKGKVYWNATALDTSGGFWNYSYFINYSLPDGTYFLNVSEYTNGYLFISNSVSFQALVVSVYSNELSYLPGETATFYYTVANTSNNGPVPGLGVNYTFEYRTAAGHQSISGVVSGGVINIVVPKNSMISSTAKMTVSASNEYGQNASTTVPVYIESLQSDISMNTQLSAGEIAIVQVNAYTNRVVSPVPGAKVYVNVTFGGNVIASYSMMGLITDAQGSASYAFMLSKNATPGVYVVDAHVYAYGWSSNSTISFTVSAPAQSYSLQLVPSQATYVAGETFMAYWALLLNGSEITGAHATYAAFVGEGAVASGVNSNGTISFLLPEGLQGDMTLTVTASADGGATASSTVSVSIVKYMLIVNPSVTEYTPGQTVKFTMTILGQGFTSSGFYYEIMDSNGNMVLSGSTSLNYFGFKVPAFPSLSYSVLVVASNRSNGGALTGSTYITEYSGLTMYLSLSASPYVGGYYTPGETITLYYNIRTTGLATSSAPYTIFVELDGVPGSERMYTVTSDKGSVLFTIPSDLSSGDYVLVANAQSGNGLSAQSLQTVGVSGAEPFWNYSILPGVSVGSLLLGIVALAALALAAISLIIIRPRKRANVKEEEEEEHQ